MYFIFDTVLEEHGVVRQRISSIYPDSLSFDESQSVLTLFREGNIGYKRPDILYVPDNASDVYKWLMKLAINPMRFIVPWATRACSKTWLALEREDQCLVLKCVGRTWAEIKKNAPDANHYYILTRGITLDFHGIIESQQDTWRA